MSRVLGFTFFLLLLAALAFITLKDMRPIAVSQGVKVLTGIDWRPVAIGGQAVPAGAGLQLRFEDDGRLNGNGGCNVISGNFRLDETAIDIGPVATSRKACPESQLALESRFLDALEGVTQISTRANRLILQDASGQILAVLAQTSPLPADSGGDRDRQRR